LLRAHPEFAAKILRQWEEWVTLRIRGTDGPYRALTPGSAENLMKPVRLLVTAVWGAVAPITKVACKDDSARLDRELETALFSRDGAAIRNYLTKFQATSKPESVDCTFSAIVHQFLPWAARAGYPPIHIESRRANLKVSGRFDAVEGYLVWAEHVRELELAGTIRAPVARAYQRVVEQYLVFLISGKILPAGRSMAKVAPKLSAAEAKLLNEKLCRAPASTLRSYLTALRRAGRGSRIDQAEWILGARFYPLLARENLVSYKWRERYPIDQVPVLPEIQQWREDILRRSLVRSGVESVPTTTSGATYNRSLNRYLGWVWLQLVTEVVGREPLPNKPTDVEIFRSLILERGEYAVGRYLEARSKQARTSGLESERWFLRSILYQRLYEQGVVQAPLSEQVGAALKPAKRASRFRLERTVSRGSAPSKPREGGTKKGVKKSKPASGRARSSGLELQGQWSLPKRFEPEGWGQIQALQRSLLETLLVRHGVLLGELGSATWSTIDRRNWLWPNCSKDERLSATLELLHTSFEQIVGRPPPGTAPLFMNEDGNPAFSDLPLAEHSSPFILALYLRDELLLGLTGRRLEVGLEQRPLQLDECFRLVATSTAGPVESVVDPSPRVILPDHDGTPISITLPEDLAQLFQRYQRAVSATFIGRQEPQSRALFFSGTGAPLFPENSLQTANTPKLVVRPESFFTLEKRCI
jgi:hypothetical protein